MRQYFKAIYGHFDGFGFYRVMFHALRNPRIYKIQPTEKLQTHFPIGTNEPANNPALRYYMNAERDKCLLRKITEYGGNSDDFRGLDFSTWEGFGALFQWASQQSWWYEFLREEGLEELTVILYTYMIEPNRFADELRRFL